MNETYGIRVGEKYGYTWIVLPEISMFNYEKVESEITELIARNPGDSLVVDLSDTVRLYSSGIGLLIRIRKQLTEKGGALYVVNISDDCLAQLREAHLHNILTLFQTQEEFEISVDEVWNNAHGKDISQNITTSCIKPGILKVSVCGNMVGKMQLHSIQKQDSSQYVEQTAWYIFDFSDLEVIDSEGITEFQQLAKTVTDNGKGCVAYGLKAHIAELMQMFGFDQFMRFFDTESEAIAYIEAHT
jgi:anti-anti-sigma factor